MITDSIYCPLCGEKRDENGLCPNNHKMKKMCLNCAHCVKGQSEDSIVCANEENRNAALNRMLEALNKENTGYSVKALDIEPIPFKKPTLKCVRWQLSEAAANALLTLFD